MKRRLKSKFACISFLGSKNRKPNSVDFSSNEQVEMKYCHSPSQQQNSICQSLIPLSFCICHTTGPQKTKTIPIIEKNVKMNLIYSCAETGQVWQARKICICLAQLNRFQDHNSSTSRFSILKALTDQTYKHQHWSSNTGSVQTELFISVYHAPQHPGFLVLLCNFNSIFNINFKGNVQNIRTLLSSTLLFELLQLLCL